MYGGILRKASKDSLLDRCDSLKSLDSDGASLSSFSSWYPSEDDSLETICNDSQAPDKLGNIDTAADSFDQMMCDLLEFSKSEGICIDEGGNMDNSFFLRNNFSSLKKEEQEFRLSLTNFDSDLETLMEDEETEIELNKSMTINDIRFTNEHVAEEYLIERKIGNVGSERHFSNDTTQNLQTDSPTVIITDTETCLDQNKIKVFNTDQTFHEELNIDRTSTTRYVIDMMLDKSLEPIGTEAEWCIVEKLPGLSLQRILEDSERIAETVSYWTEVTDNVLIFAYRRDKFALFENPHDYLLTSKDVAKRSIHIPRSDKDELLLEYFAKDTTLVPKSEGMLWLRMGQKRWKKHYFKLRGSGIYYNPKGKRISRKMVCLATYGVVNVYSGMNYQKAQKAPTDNVFCLKHPRVQNFNKMKEVHIFCAETAETMERWVTDIRLAKYGHTMYEDFSKAQQKKAHVKRGFSIVGKSR